MPELQPVHDDAAIAAVPVKRPKTMVIGAVLEELRGEFPNLAVSKLRYLEQEGLISLKRTTAGYRRFTASDVERLRYILRLQRDHGMRLKEIREHLSGMDDGTVSVLNIAGADSVVNPREFTRHGQQEYTDAELAKLADCTIDDVVSLVNASIITPSETGHFDADDLRLVGTVLALREFGLDGRHVRQVRNAANNQAGLIQQSIDYMTSGMGDMASARAEDMSIQLWALMTSLHSGLLKAALRNIAKS